MEHRDSSLIKLTGLNVNKRFNGQIVLEDVSFSIKEGEFVSILGSSGCGKTTLLKILIGIEKPDSGIICKDDVDITNKKPSERGMGLVFQNYALFPNMNVWNNVAYALKALKIQKPVYDKEGKQVLVVDKEAIKKIKFEISEIKLKIKELTKKNNEASKEIDAYNAEIAKLNEKIDQIKKDPSAPKMKGEHLPAEEIKNRVDEVINIVGLTDYVNKKPGKMSGGQQQRVAIARTLALNPDVILFDEPMAALDADIRMSLRKEIKAIQKKYNKTMIYVTHDQEEAFSMSDRIIVMNDSHIAQFDTPNNIYKNPASEFVKKFVVDHLDEKAKAILDSTR